MKLNQWTLALAAAGVVSLESIVQAEEKEQKMNPLLTAVSSTTLSGYVSTSAIWKPGTSNAGIPGRAFDAPASKHDGFNLDVVSLMLAKPLSEDDWAAGYAAQLWFGPDAVGFNTSAPNLATAGGDLAVKQAYIDVRAPIGNGIVVRLGHFNYIGGYEVPDSGDDLNYSRSYAWTLEPASHTGVLASYKATDALSLAVGVANSYNNGINWRAARIGAKAAESEKTYMGQIALTAPESFGFLKGATLSATAVNGLNNPSGDGGSVLTAARFGCYQIGGTMPTPVEGLSIGASYDYMNGPPLAFAPVPNKAGYANAATFYTSYQATEKLKLNGRAEYTTATGGFWYAPGASGNEKLLGLTGTLDYALWANVVSRLEARWDHSLTGDRPFGGTAAAPGGQKNVVTLALNLIYKF